ncbi:putative membrane protein YphA (DoxX/SURF4 family) [Pedobacter sp. CG_S7]
MMASLAIHIIAFAHLVGGILITIGLLTRFAVVIQIPILLSAIFFVNLSKGFSTLNSELWLSVIVLFLLVLFFGL